MDCAGCVIPVYGDKNNCERFCHACRRQHGHKSYCVALREGDNMLRPFIALDNPEQAAEYAGRLARQGVAHLVLSWDPVAECFSDFAEALPVADGISPVPARR